MKHLLAILILTLVLAMSVHSYVLEARDGPGGDEGGPDEGGEGGQQGCEIIVATVFYLTDCSTTGGIVFHDDVKLCEGEDYIPVGHCTTVGDRFGNVTSIELSQYSTETFQCTVYSDKECKNTIATSDSTTCAGSGTNDIESIKCIGLDG